MKRIRHNIVYSFILCVCVHVFDKKTRVVHSAKVKVHANFWNFQSANFNIYVLIKNHKRTVHKQYVYTYRRNVVAYTPYIHIVVGCRFIYSYFCIISLPLSLMTQAICISGVYDL